VEYQEGFPLFNELEKFKVKMSSTTDIEHEFLYKSYGIDIKEIIERENYNEKMLDTVDDIINSMMEVFHQSGLKVSDVNEVCLTGGTGQFNLIQERLFQIFGEEKISKHNIYQSVVGGLSEFAKQKL
jgi:molecular chaperone DnaK (HSP70)